MMQFDEKKRKFSSNQNEAGRDFRWLFFFLSFFVQSTLFSAFLRCFLPDFWTSWEYEKQTAKVKLWHHFNECFSLIHCFAFLTHFSMHFLRFEYRTLNFIFIQIMIQFFILFWQCLMIIFDNSNKFGFWDVFSVISAPESIICLGILFRKYSNFNEKFHWFHSNSLKNWFNFWQFFVSFSFNCQLTSTFVAFKNKFFCHFRSKAAHISNSAMKFTDLKNSKEIHWKSFIKPMNRYP